MRQRGEGGAESETAAANEVIGLSQSVSLLWKRPCPQKEGQRDLPVVICRDGCGRVAADKVAGDGRAWAAAANEVTRWPQKLFGLVDVAAQKGSEDTVADIAAPGRF